MKKFLFALLAAVLITGSAQARDQLSLAGSSTVLPFATIIAEEMGKTQSSKHLLLNQVAHQSVKRVCVKVLAPSSSILVMPLHA